MVVSERRKTVELEPKLMEAYADTFISRWDCYHRQLENGRYALVSRPLTLHHIANHLYGLANITLGAYALSPDNTAKWTCIDADTEEQFEGLKSLTQYLSQQGQGAYLEKSSRGGHLWMLFPTPLAGQDARRFASFLVLKANLDPQVEIYPKQDRLLEEGYGSLVRLPLGVHRKTNTRYHFITPEGEPLGATVRDQIRLLSQPDRISPEFLSAVLSQAPILESSIPSKPFVKVKAPDNLPLSEALKGSITVKEFVSRYVQLDAHNTGVCPFHDDHEFSFGVDEEGNFWNCFAGCGGGSIIDFWMRWRSLQGMDAAFTPTILELREMLLRTTKMTKQNRPRKPKAAR